MEGFGEVITDEEGDVPPQLEEMVPLDPVRPEMEPRIIVSGGIGQAGISQGVVQEVRTVLPIEGDGEQFPVLKQQRFEYSHGSSGEGQVRKHRTHHVRDGEAPFRTGDAVEVKRLPSRCKGPRIEQQGFEAAGLAEGLLSRVGQGRVRRAKAEWTVKIRVMNNAGRKDTHSQATPSLSRPSLVQ